MIGLRISARLVTVALLASAAACSSHPAPKSQMPTRFAAVGVTSGASDEGAVACASICEASLACGDASETCTTKCNAWLVDRSRAGIAQKAAACAVPKIERACQEEAARGAAKALVNCVDEAGRTALVHDKRSLFVAARAICERGARCGGGSAKDATGCVDRLVTTSPTPRGLGIFGAIRPEIVQEFASCMSSTSCEGSSATCFAGMMGEESPSSPPSESPVPSPRPNGGSPDTKI